MQQCARSTGLTLMLEKIKGIIVDFNCSLKIC